MVTGVEIGPEVVTSDDSVANLLNVENSLGRNTATVYPFGNRLRRNANSASEIRLRAEGLKSGVENVFPHDSKLIHARFMKINSPVMAHQLTAYDHAAMTSRIPQPENYATFAAWIRALSTYAGSQAALARAVGVSPQMITKYNNGGSPEPENLEKFSAYTGVSYAKIRLLVDGKPISEVKNIKDRINQTVTPLGAQIGRQWETIQDERTRSLIAEQIKIAIEQQTKLETASRKRVS